MGFTARFGYLPSVASHDEARLHVALRRLSVNASTPPAGYDSGVKSTPVIQTYDDCVPNTFAKVMRKRIVLARLPEQRASMPWPDELSRRWGYWNWLESIGKLGVETTGTEPYAYAALMNDRGWCAEQWMPYYVDGATPGINEQNAPPLDALAHAFDQKGLLKTHILADTTETRVAIASDLGVCIPFACDKLIISQGGIPNDPDYVWDFDPSSTIAGWHMIEAESYDARGVLCQNTWGTDFGWGGYVRIGWKTLATARYTMAPVAVDWVPQTSEELAEAAA